MLFIWSFLAAVAISQVNGAATRIVGGQTTSITEYPSIVQVDYRYNFMWWSQTCAGNVLTEKHVLSVAHCFTGFLFSINQRRIRAGTSVRDSGGFTIGISRAMNHPTYGTNDYEGDITVLLLEETLNFGIGIQAARLPLQGFETLDNYPVTLVGWGTTRVGGGGSSSTNLQHVSVLTINNDVCADRYTHWSRGPNVSKNMLCVGLLDTSERDACEGDQGGPTMYNNMLVGIISWGRNCADAFYPRVTTKVSAYSDWINSIIA